jgi:pilus assembly protein CpaE
MNAVAPKVLLVLEDGLDGGPIERALPPGTRIQPAVLPQPGDGQLPLLDVSDAELLLVGCSGDSERALELIESATRQAAARPPVVVLYLGSPNGFMERAFQAGADDLIALPQPHEQLAFALEKAMARRRGGTSATQAGSMIAVLGPKGGTGKTLTSCNLAEALARAGRSTVVVDLDLQFGDVGLALGLRPEKTIYDLAVAGGSLDGEKIEGYLARHESGAAVLLAPLRPDQAAAVSPSFLRTLFELLRWRYDFVIVDTPPNFTPEVIASIDSASHICVVGMLDALSLKDTKIGLETLSQMGYDPMGVTLLLNRSDTNVGIAMSEVERLLGRKPDVLVPSDRAIPRAITEGRTIVAAAPRSGAARAFTGLAETFVEARNEPSLNGTQNGTPNGETRRRRGLLRKGAH